MTNVEARPTEVVCSEGERRTQILVPRDVPLGGPRAMTVRRTLPSRARSFIGAWCFLDHYGPDDVSATGGMVVPPHPHTGLQTVSWLFTGEIEHRDSAGNVAMVRPGEVNLMTGGRGISHSENSTDASTVLHGAQLWVALPEADRDTAPGFAHHVPEPITGAGFEVRVFLGSLLGDTSPVETYTPLLGAEILLRAGSVLEIPVEAAYEHGVLVDTGGVTLRAGDERVPVEKDHLSYTPPGATTLVLEAGEEDSRLLFLGGPPFGEQIIMWWNFVGRTHQEIVGYRQEWQDQIHAGDDAPVADSTRVAAGRFGVVPDNHQAPIPAPPLPNAQLRPRR